MGAGLGGCSVPNICLLPICSGTSGLVWACSQVTAQANHINSFEAFGDIKFVDIPLAKASHMAKHKSGVGKEASPSSVREATESWPKGVAAGWGKELGRGCNPLQALSSSGEGLWGVTEEMSTWREEPLPHRLLTMTTPGPAPILPWGLQIPPFHQNTSVTSWQELFLPLEMSGPKRGGVLESGPTSRSLNIK